MSEISELEKFIKFFKRFARTEMHYNRGVADNASKAILNNIASGKSLTNSYIRYNKYISKIEFYEYLCEYKIDCIFEEFKKKGN